MPVILCTAVCTAWGSPLGMPGSTWSDVLERNTQPVDKRNLAWRPRRAGTDTPGRPAPATGGKTAAEPSHFGRGQWAVGSRRRDSRVVVRRPRRLLAEPLPGR